jgi:hypothetical protein
MEKRSWANLGCIGALEKKKEGKRGIGPTKEKRPKRFEGEEKFFFSFFFKSFYKL